MKKFIVIYHANSEAMHQMMRATHEEQKIGMEAWRTWAQKCGNNLVDLGAPLMGGQTLGANGTSTNSAKEVTGYSILQAADMNEAVSLLQGHPHSGMGSGCDIEVHEVMPLPGM